MLSLSLEVIDENNGFTNSVSSGRFPSLFLLNITSFCALYSLNFLNSSAFSKSIICVVFPFSDSSSDADLATFSLYLSKNLAIADALSNFR